MVIAGFFKHHRWGTMPRRGDRPVGTYQPIVPMMAGCVIAAAYPKDPDRGSRLAGKSGKNLFSCTFQRSGGRYAARCGIYVKVEWLHMGTWSTE